MALLADVAAIVEGIEGANIVSIFSTSLENSGFLVTRTLPATAAVFTEPQTADRRKNLIPLHHTPEEKFIRNVQTPSFHLEIKTFYSSKLIACF